MSTNNKTMTDSPILYEDTSLFGQNAPLIILLTMVLFLLFFAFLKHQYINLNKPQQRVTVTTQATDISDGSYHDSETAIPQDVIIMKIKKTE